MSDQTTLSRPVSAIDPFSHAFLRDPYPHHEALREAGPVVWLEHYGIWAMARHEQVRDALTDWQTYCSSAGVGLSDFRKEPPWRPPSIILEADPPLHTRTRAVLTRILSPAAIKILRETFEREAELLVARLVEQREFDGIADLAEAYPLKVFPDAVGLSEDGRENLMPYGSMVFNSFGPRNDLFEQASCNTGPVRDWIMSKCSRAALAPGKLGRQIFEAVDAGELTEDEAGMLVRSFLSAGVDTTVYGLGNALYCLTRYPEQWRALRDNPALIRGAFEEVLRFEAPVQSFFRTTTRAVEVGDVRLGDGEKVMLLFAAANRDPRRWERPDTFDVTRRATGHMTFGTGIHGCVGQAVARLETEAVLSALVKRVASFEFTAEPRQRLNNTLRGSISCRFASSRSDRMEQGTVLIVGASHAGFQVAVSLRQHGYAGRIGLINDEAHLPYQRPPLSKAYLKGTGGPDSLMFRPDKFYRDQNVELIGERAVVIDRAARRLLCASGASLEYAHLVLATGARNRMLDIPNANLPDVRYLRTLDESDSLRQRMVSAKRVVVVGAGFIGLEFAATARAKGLEVDVIELGARVMARAVTAEISEFFQARHTASGIRIHLGVQTTGIESDGKNVTGVSLSDGRHVPADLVVVGVGVLPNIELAAEAGLSVAAGIIVNEQLLTSDPNISAIGDCALFASPRFGGSLRLESVQNATDQARCVAARLTGDAKTYDGLPWFWSDQGDDKLQIAGLTTGYDHVVVRGDRAQRSFSAFCYKAGQLVGIESINRAGDHVFGRKILGLNRSIEPEQAGDLSFDLKAALA